MSRYFPHTSHAEDQPLPYTILTTHVLTRGLTTGSLAGLTAAAIRQAVPSLRRPGPGPGPATHRVLLASSTGSLVGFGLMALALGGRMYGRDRIEWQDRSWRLLENRGQVEMDDWTYVGMAVGGIGGIGAARVAASGAVRRGLGGGGLGGGRAVLGGLGAGGALGMLGSAAWAAALS